MNKNQWTLGNSYTVALPSPARPAKPVSKRSLRRLYRRYLFSYSFETIGAKTK